MGRLCSWVVHVELCVFDLSCHKHYLPKELAFFGLRRWDFSPILPLSPGYRGADAFVFASHLHSHLSSLCVHPGVHKTRQSKSIVKEAEHDTLRF